LIGILLAMLAARLIRSTLLRGKATPFVMELPPYRMPTLRGVVIHMWERAWLFLKKAGTIILAISIVLWALTSYPKKTSLDVDYGPKLADAEREYLEGVKAVNPLLGLADGSETLLKAMKAELAMASEQEKYHKHQKGFKKAQRKKDHLIGTLNATGEGETVSKFLQIRDAVQKATWQFQTAIERSKIEENTRQYAMLERQRDEKLRNAEEVDARVYAAVKKYLEEVRAPFDQEKQTIQRERAAREVAYSYAGRIGRTLEPVVKPLGFDWKIATALVGAFAAKEVFVAQMGIVFSVGEAKMNPDNLRHRLRENYSSLVAFCIMLFTLISMPCVATIAVTKRETGRWTWALFQLAGLTALAYVVTLLVYQIGSLLA